MTDVINEKKWYVIRAISGKEKKVKQYIDAEIGRLKLDDFVAQVLIPTEKVYQIKNGKKVSKEFNIFKYASLLVSGRPGSNRPPSAWKADALPNELLPLINYSAFLNFTLFTSKCKISLVGREGFEPSKS